MKGSVAWIEGCRTQLTALQSDQDYARLWIWSDSCITQRRGIFNLEGNFQRPTCRSL